MMNRVFSIVLYILLVISIFLFGMFWSFKAGGMLIALDCNEHQSFYANGKLYVCIPRERLLEKYLGIKPQELIKPKTISF